MSLLLWRMTKEESLVTELNSLTNARWLNQLPGDPNIDHHLKWFTCYSVLSVTTGICLPNRCLAMDYSVSIPFLGNLLTEPLPSNCHIRHNTMLYDLTFQLRRFCRQGIWNSYRIVRLRTKTTESVCVCVKNHGTFGMEEQCIFLELTLCTHKGITNEGEIQTFRFLRTPWQRCDILVCEWVRFLYVTGNPVYVC
jgi:hypothetical protein